MVGLPKPDASYFGQFANELIRSSPDDRVRVGEELREAGRLRGSSAHGGERDDRAAVADRLDGLRGLVLGIERESLLGHMVELFQA